MKHKILLLAVALLAMTSCNVLKTYTVKSIDIYGSGVIHKPVIADLEVSEDKVTGTATGKSGLGLTEIKKLAVVDAVNKVGADILVEPKFITETKNGWTTATVNGFPANYRNFRSIQAEDVELLKVGVLQKANVYVPSEERKKGRRFLVGGGE
ncbi:MAG TPA: hypothetical protein PKN44_15695 [Bacteroidales bacterium]|nr:hypothetical protein [Bacteroidales bacterium]